ncbi:MAG: hypothetical protein ACKVVP_14465 [Chloroflexota bacterium]
MTVIHGVVRGGVVLLPDSAQLPDGVEVEIRPIDGSHNENEFYRRLLEAGLISELPTKRESIVVQNFVPIQVSGLPLSEQIIEDRR